ncbi:MULTISPECIES: GGDEF domain-containing protein [unclassified Arthrobacter]|uniref:GGDEF domain-containing protein n=1 Tax=unclassified Arthrobacter TaxID=235627 RepID=UPI001C858569|nr:GGDEF domain-containing protein [Arthrobacter sp. MAHUQ-56]MBX7443349.1 GGDEF domain-containing protein [Arthrobacter sp. MAHUQ-56]
MALDIVTLRIAFALMAFVLMLLFYFWTYRPTRSPYSGWWCVALLSYLAGSACFLLNRTIHQVWANPSGNVLLVCGGLAVWAGARSLRTAGVRRWAFFGVPLATLSASVLDNPAVNVWSGGPVFLAAMSFTFAMTSWELWRLDSGYSTHRLPMAAVSGALAGFYVLRLLVFLQEGQNGPHFVSFFGPAVTTLVTAVMLVVSSFSMASLSSEQQMRTLATAASRDGLTGLLNRTAFLDLGARQLDPSAKTGACGALIMADLDHFKSVNDTHGHAAGDAALRFFAQACTAAVRSTDLVGRYGGEEFVLLIPGASADTAEAITRDINRHFAAAPMPSGANVPTVSYGISTYSGEATHLAELMVKADTALYTAKSGGRNRAVRSDGRPGIRRAE